MLRVVVILALLAVAGCDTGEPTLSRPRIERPLDASGYMSAEHVCELFDQPTAAGQGWKDGDPKALSIGDFWCSYGSTTTPTLGLLVTITSTDYLSRAYEYQNSGKDSMFTFAQPLSVEGQPAAKLIYTARDPSTACRIAIGLTENTSLTVDIDDILQHDIKPCELAIAASETIVRKLVG